MKTTPFPPSSIEQVRGKKSCFCSDGLNLGDKPFCSRGQAAHPCSATVVLQASASKISGGSLMPSICYHHFNSLLWSVHPKIQLLAQASTPACPIIPVRLQLSQLAPKFRFLYTQVKLFQSTSCTYWAIPIYAQMYHENTVSANIIMQDGCSVACAKWADGCHLIYSRQETIL